MVFELQVQRRQELKKHHKQQQSRQSLTPAPTHYNKILLLSLTLQGNKARDRMDPLPLQHMNRVFKNKNAILITAKLITLLFPLLLIPDAHSTQTIVSLGA
jgi:hypothetical protein